jgi:hypothetical protein
VESEEPNIAHDIIYLTIEGFVTWFNDKYDTGYESGIAEEHVQEYMKLLTTPSKEIA